MSTREKLRKYVQNNIKCQVSSCESQCELAKQRTFGYWWAYCTKCGFTFKVPMTEFEKELKSLKNINIH